MTAPAMINHEVFIAKRATTGKCQVTAQFRRDEDTGTVYAEAFSATGAPFEIAFTGAQADAFLNGLGARLNETIQDNLLGDNFEPSIDIRQETTMTGSFRQKSLKDAAGNTFLVWQLVAAEWSYEVMERGKPVLVTEGFLPEKTAA